MTFDIENDEAREALARAKEHLPGNLIWDRIDPARPALEADMEARLALYRAVRARVEAGLPLVIVRELSSTVADAVSEHYVIALHVAGFSHAIGREDWRRTREQFTDGRGSWMPAPAPGTPKTMSLGSVPVIDASEALADQAIEIFLDVQAELHSWPEAISAAVAYHHATQVTDLVRSSLKRIEDLQNVPGTCRDCPGQVTLRQSDT